MHSPIFDPMRTVVREVVYEPGVVQPFQPTASLDYDFMRAVGDPITDIVKHGVFPTFAIPLRFDHDPITGVPLGLLIEDARTNLCLQSEDISTTWINVRSTEIVNSVVAPDGNMTADTLREDGSAATTHYIQQTLVNADFTDNVDYTFSRFVKKTANRNWVRLSPRTKGNVTKVAFFDVNAGTIGNVDAGWTSRIQDVGDGWFRCSVSGDIGSGAANPAFLALVAEANGDSVFDGLTQDGLYLWGAQVEKGSFPTSYIKTTTVPVARDADFPVTLTDLGWFNPNAGTFYIEGSFPYASPSAHALLTIDDGGVPNRLYFERDAAENINFQTSHSTDTDGASNGAAVIAAGTKFKVAGAYANNDVRAAVNGVLSPADVSAAFPLANAMTTLRFGQYSGGNMFNGHIAKVKYWNSRKSDGFLQDITKL